MVFSLLVNYTNNLRDLKGLWRRGVVVIAVAQLHSTKFKLRLYGGPEVKRT